MCWTVTVSELKGSWVLMCFSKRGSVHFTVVAAAAENVGFTRLDFLDGDASTKMVVTLRAARTTEMLLRSLATYRVLTDTT